MKKLSLKLEETKTSSTTQTIRTAGAHGSTGSPMKHTLTPQRILHSARRHAHRSVGDTLLSHGMAQVGPVTLAHRGLLLAANPQSVVITGILCLLGFFASYLTALSGPT